MRPEDKISTGRHAEVSDIFSGRKRRAAVKCRFQLLWFGYREASFRDQSVADRFPVLQ